MAPLLEFTLAIAMLNVVVMGTNSSNAYLTNTTTATTLIPQKSATTSTTKPATITSCGGTIDYWDSFLNETILSWYYSSPKKYSSVWESVWTQISTLDSRYVMIQANPWTIPTATWNSYESSIVNAESSLYSILWGASQDAVNTFAYSPWTDDGCLWATCTSQLYSMSSAYASATPSGYFEYTAKPPCCSNCLVGAKAVRLAYWPTPAPVPAVSTLVDSNGTTYVSPSVYAWFTRMSAWDGCSNIGPSFTDAFLSFHPTDLRTSVLASDNIWAANNHWTTINYADFGPTCTCTIPACPSDVLVGYQTNTCTPQLSMPNAVKKIFPEWAGCDLNFDGVFDPPYALTVQPGLTTPKSTVAKPTSSPPTNIPSNTPSTGPSAQPASIPTTPGPNPTTPPVITPQPTTSAAMQSLAVSTGAFITTAGAIIVVNEQTITANSQGEFVLGTATASLNANGNIVFGTQTLSLQGPGQIIATAAPTLVINGQTITANSQGSFIVGTQTLSPNSQGDLVIDSKTVTPGGQAITISGTEISLAAGNTETVLSTKLGSVILSFISGGDASQTASTANTANSTMNSNAQTSIPIQITGSAALGAEKSFSLLLGAVILLLMTI